jgi:hypothetical protein
VARYQRGELSATVSGAWTNPFDPDQAEVWAELTSPSGRALRVPAFWFQDYAESPPTAPVRRQMESVALFVYDRDWSAGTQCEVFLDDVSLLDAQDREVPYDDMETGEVPRQEALDAAPLAYSSAYSHGGKRALRFAPTFNGTTRWPTVHFRLGGADWTAYRGLVIWAYAKPMMITEFGPGIEGPAPGLDPEAINLHNGIWASLLGGSAGCALNWHWWYVHDRDLYRRTCRPPCHPGGEQPRGRQLGAGAGVPVPAPPATARAPSGCRGKPRLWMP